MTISVKVYSTLPSDANNTDINATFVDSNNVDYVRSYTVPNSINIDQFVSSKAFELQNELIDSEINDYIGAVMSGNPKDSSKAKQADKAKIDKSVLIAFISQPIELGPINSAEYFEQYTAQQLASYLGLSAGDSADIKTVIRNIRLARDSLVAAEVARSKIAGNIQQ